MPAVPRSVSAGNGWPCVVRIVLLLEGLMGTSAKAVVMSLFCANVFAVCLGFMGIGKLERHHAYPFNVHDGGMQTFCYSAYYIQGRTVLFWHSPWGALLVWAGTIILPLIAAVVIFGKERPLIGTALLLLSFVPFGITGFLIWLHAFIDLPHDW
jgi:hypothetical protein